MYQKPFEPLVYDNDADRDSLADPGYQPPDIFANKYPPRLERESNPRLTR